MKKRPAKRFENDSQPLSANPFESLKDAFADEDLREGPAAVPKAPGEAPPFQVRRTRKGGWPVSRERRAGGKWVTIISNVEGDRDRLLRALRKRLGAGGAVRGESVEVQGDHAGTVSSILDELL